MSGLEIIQLSPEQWPLFKEIRLEALKTEPRAFGSTYAETVLRPDSFWQGRLAEAAEGQTAWMLFAREQASAADAPAAGRIVGLMGAHVAEDGVPEVISVYVTGDCRGKGVGKALMARLLETLRQRGFPKARLGVTREQTAAVALYRSFGFKIVGSLTKRLADGLDHEQYIMEAALVEG